MLKAEELRRMVAEATPGPWYVSDDWNVSAPGKTVLHGSVMVESDAESDANAALAALAPTLATEHAALQDRVARLEAALKHIADYDDPYEPCGWAINTARAALAEAAP